MTAIPVGYRVVPSYSESVPAMSLNIHPSITPPMQEQSILPQHTLSILPFSFPEVFCPVSSDYNTFWFFLRLPVHIPPTIPITFSCNKANIHELIND